MATVTLTQADSGKTIQVRPGDTIVITLDENPSTGYRWAIDRQDPAIQIVDDAYTSGGSNPGAAGTRRFTLRVDRSGTAPFGLKLWRAWEGDTSVLERFEVVLRIGE